MDVSLVSDLTVRKELLDGRTATSGYNVDFGGASYQRRLGENIVTGRERLATPTAVTQIENNSFLIASNDSELKQQDPETYFTNDFALDGVISLSEIRECSKINFLEKGTIS